MRTERHWKMREGEPEDIGGLWKLERTRKQSPLELPKELLTLDFNPMKLISDSQPPEM